MRIPIEGNLGQDRPYPIIAGGSQEVTSVAKFTVNNVGGRIVGQRMVSGQMVGGRMEGGQTVEVPGVLTDEDFLPVREIIAEEVNTSKNHITIDMVQDEARIIENLGADSLAIGDLGLKLEDEILNKDGKTPHMVFPPQFAYVLGTVGQIRQALDIMLLKESPLPSVELGEAKLQLLNAYMFQRLEVARERAKQKGDTFDDSAIAEITSLS